MRIIRPLILFLLMWLGSGVCIADALRLTTVNLDTGLPGDCVYCIVKDSRGLMWIGTNNGVAVYDGWRVTSLQCDAPRGQNLVTSIVELPNGDMAVGMRGGLYVVHVPSLSIEHTLPAIRSVRCLLVWQGQLLVGASDGLVEADVSLQNEHTITLGNSRISTDNALQAITMDKKGTVWMASESALFRMGADKKPVRIAVDELIKNKVMRCLCVLNGKLFLGTSNGLMVSGDGGRSFRALGGQQVISDLRSDGRHLFVSTDGDGAYEMDATTELVTASYPYNPQSALPSGSVYTFWRDTKLGICWFGYFRAGLQHTLHTERTVMTYRFPQKATSADCLFDSREYDIRSFCLHAPFKMIGTRGGAWLVDESRNAVTHFDEDALGGRNVLDIIWTNDHFVVATFDGGLSTVDPSTGVCRRAEDPSLRATGFTRLGLLTYQGKQVVIALSHNLQLLDSSLHIVRQFTHQNSSLTGEVLTDFLDDGTGKVWLSTATQMCMMDLVNNNVQTEGFPQGFFNHEPAMNFAQMTNGNVLASSERYTYNCQTDLSRWDSIDISTRLNVNTVSFISPCGLDAYWVGTDRGLFRMDSTFCHFIHYGRSTGLETLFCNPHAVCHMKDGSFWFSTSHGLHYVKDGALPTQTGTYFLGEISTGNLECTYEQCLTYSEEHRIPVSWNFGHEDISITPILLDYSDYKGRYIAWQLDDEPLSASSDLLPITLCHLSLGRHTLRLFYPDGKVATTYTVSVWPSWLFCLEVAFVVLLFVSGFLFMQYMKSVKRYRLARRRKHKLDMELSASQAVHQYKQEKQRQQKAQEEARREAMYQRSRSTEADNKRLLRQVRQYMEDEHPYRSAELRVADVAKAVGTTPNRLSQMFSLYAKVSFYDFVNDYRVEEFKRRALSPKYAHLSTIAIAETCGFKKTSFYSAFNKKEGCTPAEWLKQQSSSKPNEQ